MSFDIFFQTARFFEGPPASAPLRAGRPPSRLQQEPLSAAESQAVEKVVRSTNAQGPDEHGCYVVELDDGSLADVYARDFAAGCMVSIRGLTDEMTKFLFDLLVAGQWVMIPAMDDIVAITTAPHRLKDLPVDFPKVIDCRNADELKLLLSDGVQAWQRFRDSQWDKNEKKET